MLCEQYSKQRQRSAEASYIQYAICIKYGKHGEEIHAYVWGSGSKLWVVVGAPGPWMLVRVRCLSAEIRCHYCSGFKQLRSVPHIILLYTQAKNISLSVWMKF